MKESYNLFVDCEVSSSDRMVPNGSPKIQGSICAFIAERKAIPSSYTDYYFLYLLYAGSSV